MFPANRSQFQEKAMDISMGNSRKPENLNIQRRSDYNRNKSQKRPRSAMSPDYPPSELSAEVMRVPAYTSFIEQEEPLDLSMPK